MNAVSNFRQQRRGEMNWQVIDMARRDGPASLDPDGLLVRLTRGLFGRRVPHGLSNPVLEALRRFCVRAWYWDYVPARELNAFLGAGYSEADARRILAYVAHHRGFTPSLLAAA